MDIYEKKLRQDADLVREILGSSYRKCLDDARDTYLRVSEVKQRRHFTVESAKGFFVFASLSAVSAGLSRDDMQVIFDNALKLAYESKKQYEQEKENKK